VRARGKTGRMFGDVRVAHRQKRRMLRDGVKTLGASRGDIILWQHAYRCWAGRCDMVDVAICVLNNIVARFMAAAAGWRRWRTVVAILANGVTSDKQRVAATRAKQTSRRAWVCRGTSGSE